jgi:hypothetical protein
MEVETSYSETRKRKIPCRRELLIVSLQRFYNSHNDLSTLIPILKGEGELSLRVIDWFVTNYAKKHHISYSVDKQEFIVLRMITDTPQKPIPQFVKLWTNLLSQKLLLYNLFLIFFIYCI